MLSDIIARADRQFKELSLAYGNVEQERISDCAISLIYTVNSIPDHLCAMAKEKFKFKECDCKKSMEKETDGARKFLKWFCEKKEERRKDPICDELREIRNVNTHETLRRLDLVHVKRYMDLGVSMRAQIEAREPDGTVKHIDMVDKQVNTGKNSKSGTTIDYGFQCLPNQTVLEACESFLKTMKELVESAQKRFSF